MMIMIMMMVVVMIKKTSARVGLLLLLLLLLITIVIMIMMMYNDNKMCVRIRKKNLPTRHSCAEKQVAQVLGRATVFGSVWKTLGSQHSIQRGVFRASNENLVALLNEKEFPWLS